MNISGDVTVFVLLKAKIDGWQVSLLLNIVNINTLYMTCSFMQII